MINELKTQGATRLYDLPRSEEGIRIDFPEGDISDGSGYILFFHTDGMYSYCKTEKGATIHLMAMALVEKTGDRYKIAYEPY